ncbi:MAG: GNAT family N-acetyltransferase [Candidatus Dormibacteria bacterium]
MDSWPLYGIRIRTARLELRLPDLDLLDELAKLAARGIHDPDLMPFGNSWTDQPSPQLERSVVQYHLLQVAQWRPERWCFNPVAIHEGRVVGIQDLRAEEFAVSRSFSTGSWLGREHQGRGFGKEMRAAILHLGFATLGAEEALTSAFSDNPASIRVTRGLGYEENGTWRAARRGRPATHDSFRLTRQRWLSQSRHDVFVEGIEPCLELFGVSPEPSPKGPDEV